MKMIFKSQSTTIKRGRYLLEFTKDKQKKQPLCIHIFSKKNKYKKGK